MSSGIEHMSTQLSLAFGRVQSAPARVRTENTVATPSEEKNENTDTTPLVPFPLHIKSSHRVVLGIFKVKANFSSQSLVVYPRSSE